MNLPPTMTPHEEEVLRILNGEDVPGWAAGAAMWTCAEWLKDNGYACGQYQITQKGKDYLAGRSAMPVCPKCQEHHFPETLCAPRSASATPPSPTAEAPALPPPSARLLTIIESPYAGAVAANLTYARYCVAHSIDLGEIPFASHLFYTQHRILDDRDPVQRQKGIVLGQAFFDYAKQVAVYDDLGVSPGMQEGIAFARSLGLPVHFRRILGDAFMLAPATPAPNLFADGADID